MIGPIARIIARYVLGAGMAYGLLDPSMAEAIRPDVVLFVGAALGAVVEGAYAIARRRGWAT